MAAADILDDIKRREKIADIIRTVCTCRGLLAELERNDFHVQNKVIVELTSRPANLSEKILDFMFPHEPAPGVVYHYTSFDAFEGIVSVDKGQTGLARATLRRAEDAMRREEAERRERYVEGVKALYHRERDIALATFDGAAAAEAILALAEAIHGTDLSLTRALFSSEAEPSVRSISIEKRSLCSRRRAPCGSLRRAVSFDTVMA